MEQEKKIKFIRASNKFIYSAIILATALVFFIFGLLVAFLYMSNRENLLQNNGNVGVTVTPTPEVEIVGY